MSFKSLCTTTACTTATGHSVISSMKACNPDWCHLIPQRLSVPIVGPEIFSLVVLNRKEVFHT